MTKPPPHPRLPPNPTEQDLPEATVQALMYEAFVDGDMKFAEQMKAELDRRKTPTRRAEARGKRR